MDIDTYMRAARGENVGTHISWPQIGRQLATEIDDLRVEVEELRAQRTAFLDACDQALAADPQGGGRGMTVRAAKLYFEN